MAKKSKELKLLPLFSVTLHQNRAGLIFMLPLDVSLFHCYCLIILL